MLRQLNVTLTTRWPQTPVSRLSPPSDTVKLQPSGFGPFPGYVVINGVKPSMFNLYGSTFRHCDRVSRREVLKVGTLALGGLSLANGLRARAAEPPPPTAVIQVFLGGGPSHIDMFDMKPHAPVEIRGEFNEISTNVPGTRICELLPQIATVMDKISIVRSVTHSNPAHLPGSHFLQTGYDVPTAIAGENQHPSTGSIAAYMRGANAGGMPAYVSVPRCQAFAHSSFLGQAYSPFTTQIDPNDKNYHVPNLTLQKGTSIDRVHERRGLMQQLDRLRRDMDNRGDLQSLDQFAREAFEMVTNERTAEAFDITREPEELRDRYGRTSIGQNCLLARRLVESGVTFVSCLSGGGWDTHADNFNLQRNVTLPRLDQAISALVTDLFERGLDRHVLVNVMGEFGRTPKINKDAGRDHWPGASFALFSGGGLQMGQMIGTTDKHAAYPTSKPFSPEDVLSTIYHVLGINHHHVLRDASQRPIPILPSGKPIPDLI